MSNGKFSIPKSNGPNMDDVPFGEARPDYRPSSIGQGLLDLAAWFDIYDDRSGYNGDRTVQKDLRNWAARTMDMPADRVKVESDGDPNDIIGIRKGSSVVDPNEFCKFCGSTETPRWWKCCPEHCTQRGPDVVCQTCYLDKHPDAIITY